MCIKQCHGWSTDALGYTKNLSTLLTLYAILVFMGQDWAFQRLVIQSIFYFDLIKYIITLFSLVQILGAGKVVRRKEYFLKDSF